MLEMERCVPLVSKENSSKGCEYMNEKLEKCTLKAIFLSSPTKLVSCFLNRLISTGGGVIGALPGSSGGMGVGGGAGGRSEDVLNRN